MNVLGLDVGSSSVKAAIVCAGKIVGKASRAEFPTRFHGVRVEVDPAGVLRAVAKAARDLGSRARHVDFIALSVMAPAWVAMDRAGRALTPIVTHQDRRSVETARVLLKRVGAKRFLKIAGNLPIPGGISITTAAWFAAHERSVMRKADLCGHLNTFLHRQITRARVIDPSNASFTGLYETVKQGTWSEELCEAAGISRTKLPEIVESNHVAGKVCGGALGLTNGTPVVVGMIDTGAAMLLAGTRVGQLLNVSGSTDVLGLCTNVPRPHERLLTRALGVGKWWMSVGTLAAAGSSLAWVKRELFADMSDKDFYRLAGKLLKSKCDVRFDPYLAGDRMSIEQKQASFTGLTLASTRQEMLGAVIDALAKASAARMELLESRGVKIRHDVVTSGGAARALHKILHRDWTGNWTFRFEDEATVRGLSLLEPV